MVVGAKEVEVVFVIVIRYLKFCDIVRSISSQERVA